MASFNKFHCFVEDLAEGKHNLGSDTLKVFLTNEAPVAASDTAYDGATGSTGPAEIANGNGYTTGGNTASVSTSSQTSGTYKLVLADPATWTASGSVGPFQYAVLYNDTAAGKNLIGWWNYGSAVTLASGETFKVDFSPDDGALVIT